MNRPRFQSRNFLLAACFASAALAGCGGDATPPLLVDTTEGAVQGVLTGEVRTFLGIPYAAPPVGSRRFLPPEAPLERDGTLEANAFGDGCPALPDLTDLLVRPTVTSEDCLTLNVWSPNQNGRRPVLLWIHGGGYYAGSSAAAIYDGANLALGGDVVVVSINYRLGALGFMSTDALRAERASLDGGAGNMGILDMLAALRWVKANISGFGGDPDNVTIFGESAGGSAVCALLAANGNDDLIHRAIIQSGICGAAPLRAGSEGTLDRGDALVAQLGCSGPDELACLRALSPAQIRDGVLAVSNEFLPTIDNATFTDSPLALLRSGEAADVPMIVGSNLDEISIFAIGAPDTVAEVRENFLAVAGGDGAVADMLMSLYGVDTDAEAKAAFITAGTDQSFSCEALATANAAAAAGRAVYLYEFQHVVGDPSTSFGAAHGFEIPFVFGTLDAFGLFSGQLGEREALTNERMVNAWSSFARTGTPEFEGGWPRFTSEDHEYLVIDEPSSVDDDFRSGRCAMLASLGLL